MGVAESQLEELTDNNEHAIKTLGINSVLGSHAFIPFLLNKTWVLFQTTSSHPLYISDNPFTLHNQNDYGPYGNIGVGVKGIEIYFPISSCYTLGLLCQTIGEEYRKAYYNIQILENFGSRSHKTPIKYPKDTRLLCEGVVLGRPIPLAEDNVTMFNSLQVGYSSRFVYCRENKFSLVQKMIDDNPKYKEGFKLTVS